MKKRRQGRTLSRTKDQKIALLRTLLVSLVKYKRIETTLAKAKELKPFAEKMVTKASKSSISSSALIRGLKKDLPAVAIKELLRIAEIAKERKGGYLRIIKTSPRKRDMAPMAIIEWVDDVSEAVDKKETTDKKSDSEKKDDKEKAKK